MFHCLNHLNLPFLITKHKIGWTDWQAVLGDDSRWNKEPCIRWRPREGALLRGHVPAYCDKPTLVPVHCMQQNTAFVTRQWCNLLSNYFGHLFSLSVNKKTSYIHLIILISVLSDFTSRFILSGAKARQQLRQLTYLRPWRCAGVELLLALFACFCGFFSLSLSSSIISLILCFDSTSSQRSDRHPQTLLPRWDAGLKLVCTTSCAAVYQQHDYYLNIHLQRCKSAAVITVPHLHCVPWKRSLTFLAVIQSSIVQF